VGGKRAPVVWRPWCLVPLLREWRGTGRLGEGRYCPRRPAAAVPTRAGRCCPRWPVSRPRLPGRGQAVADHCRGGVCVLGLDRSFRSSSSYQPRQAISRDDPRRFLGGKSRASAVPSWERRSSGAAWRALRACRWTGNSHQRLEAECLLEGVAVRARFDANLGVFSWQPSQIHRSGSGFGLTRIDKSGSINLQDDLLGSSTMAPPPSCSASSPSPAPAPSSASPAAAKARSSETCSLTSATTTTMEPSLRSSKLGSNSSGTLIHL